LRGGLNDVLCMCDAWREAASCALLTLAGNLEAAAALCAAFVEGARQCSAEIVAIALEADMQTAEEVLVAIRTPQRDVWIPGCGRKAPGWGEG
jgi:hypothetical protein